MVFGPWGTRRLAAALATLTLVLLGACDGIEKRTGVGQTTPSPSPQSTNLKASTSIHEVEIFLYANDDEDCARVTPVARTVEGPAVLRGAMDLLLEGPTSEEKGKGYGGWFSPKTAGMLNDVTLNEGTARIDFDDFSKVIPNASTSCGSATLLAQLDSTAKQFPTVKRAIYSIDGSPDKFYSWLQMDTPT